MKIGYLGLGKMGKNMVFNLLEKNIEVVVWNRSPESIREVEKAGAIGADSVENMVGKLDSKRIVWLMLPAGEVTNNMIEKLTGLMGEGDLVIDGSNSFYKDSIVNHQKLQKKGVKFVDVGVSGGPAGARSGACLMVGGSQENFKRVEEILKVISVPGGYQFFSGVGAGHYVKMVHNGIEYGMMQALAEGFNMMKKSEFGLDLEKIANLYNHSSVIESRLVGWLESGLKKNGEELAEISGKAKQSGEGKWAVEEAERQNLPTPAIKVAVDYRIKTQDKPDYLGRLVSVMRNEFGGHEVGG